MYLIELLLFLRTFQASPPDRWKMPTELIAVMDDGTAGLTTSFARFPPLSLPSSLFPVFFYTTCSLLFLRFVRDHCSLFWKSYTLADLSVCAKIPNGVPFRRYCRSVGFVYY